MKQQNKGLLPIVIISIIIIVCCSGYLYDLFVTKPKQIQTAAFKTELEETFEMYGDSIERVSVDTTGVAIFVNTRKWNHSDAKTKKEFQKEMYYIIHEKAIECEVMPRAGIFVSIFTSERETINAFTVKP